MGENNRAGLYLFPRNDKATHASLEEQAAKVYEEATEVVAAVSEDEGKRRIIEETLDCIQACEGVLRRYSPFLVCIQLARVKIKCLMRGDYDE